MPYKDPTKKKEYNYRCTKKWREENREEHLAKRREYRRKIMATDAGKLQRRKESLKHLYGITLEQYDDLLLEQNGRCAICGSDTPGHKHKHFSVDHNHKTKQVRGLLCHFCNRGLGFLEDDINVVKKAFDYLKKYEGELCRE